MSRSELHAVTGAPQDWCQQASSALERVATAASGIILGKPHAIRLALTCLLARGHLLIEDLPGVGKTVLAHSLAQILGLSFRRIQFTSDLLPADILGVSIFNRDTSQFSFQPGPIFAQVLLADEVNRATPRTQSALLEAMEEAQVTVDGETHPLPQPFFVIATQNPANQIGTFPLPESQLDRFLMRIELGYPHREAERALLTGRDRRDLLAELQPELNPEQLVEFQHHVGQVIASDALLDYLQDLLEFSRSAPQFRGGLSARAGLGILRAAQAWALLHGRPFVLPEDLQAVLSSVAAHRLKSSGDAAFTSTKMMLDGLIEAVPIPR